MVSQQEIKVTRELDATGLLCPEPLMLVRNILREMKIKEVILVVATDPSTERDFNNLCRFMGHEIVLKKVNQDKFEYWIRKGSL
tara:strand:+ start:683 stop:934 length:252 start_codon:yes stop_codon:yes gene_type:complete